MIISGGFLSPSIDASPARLGYIAYGDDPLVDTDLFLRFGVALVIGILVGLQREYAFGGPEKEVFAGVRTFALLGLIGCAAAFFADLFNSPWPFVAIVLVVGAFLTVTYFIDAWRGDVGLTTEVSAILTVLAGALAYWEQLILAIALGVTTAVLLTIKFEARQFVQQLTREDLFATLKMAVITAIVLPLLPNETFGPPPFNIFNPFTIWLLVVFISGINFIGYILVKLLGPQRGIGLTGLVGGLASSTAVTLGFTQRSKVEPMLEKPFALAITLAWTVMFARVIIQVAVVNAALLVYIALPVLAAILVGLGYSLYLYLSKRTEEERDVNFTNPFQLGPAIFFGLIFLLVLFIARAAQVYLGDVGLYASSFISGLATVDAITLSLSQLSRDPAALDHVLASRAIVLAAVANTFAKGSIVMFGGTRGLRIAILPAFILMMGVSIILMFTI
jgi:uncharacterized membrane protein (DUF4010 family)